MKRHYVPIPTLNNRLIFWFSCGSTKLLFTVTTPGTPGSKEWPLERYNRGTSTVLRAPYCGHGLCFQLSLDSGTLCHDPRVEDLSAVLAEGQPTVAALLLPPILNLVLLSHSELRLCGSAALGFKCRDLRSDKEPAHVDKQT